jgi:hypothetical protein
MMPPNISDSQRSKKRSLSFLLWIPLVLLMFFLISLPVLNWWPPISVEQRTQRQKLAERVQSAGGWDAIRRDCIALAEQNPNGFRSGWHDTNLPPAIVALSPLLVQYSPKDGCVRMRIFGMHRTGGHSTPYFGLEVDTSTNSISYQHGSGYADGGVIGSHYSEPERVANGIYEIY